MGVDRNAKTKLYIRLPVKISEELQIKELNGNIKEVFLPRQKSSRWCTVSLENQEKQKKTIEDLKKVKVEGKNIVVKVFKKKEKVLKREDSILNTEGLKSLLKD